MRTVLRLLVGLTLLLGGLAVAWLLGMRRKDSRVVSLQRRINKKVLNPRQLQTAGTPGAYAAIIQHVGRSSGRQYRTPVGAEPMPDGFVVALVYGTGSDWLRNVLASGTAVVVHEGQEYPVDRPQVVPLDDVADAFGPEALRPMRVVGVTQALRLRHADVD